MCHLANAHYMTGPASGNTGRLFCRLAGLSVLVTGLAIVHWIGCINAIKIMFKRQIMYADKAL